MLFFIQSQRLLRRQQGNLNTSHVILYLNIVIALVAIMPFKYISCYSLSDVDYIVVFGLYKFKYISCYSLSRVNFSNLSIHEYLNTSHVILYRIIFSMERSPHHI